jgi:cobalt-zinc-cadmium efflux system membrane fusion protein
MSHAITLPNGIGTRWRQLIPWLGMGLCLLILSVHLALDVAANRRIAVEAGLQGSGTEGSSGAPPLSEPVESPSTVVLTETKFRAAGITTEPVRLEQIATELGVPGRVEVNADRRIEIRPRAAGVVREVHAVLGQNVRRGDLLLTLDSPEIGTARLNLQARRRELHTARIEAEWKTQVAETVAALIPEIRKGTDLAAIEREFADKPLGSYRGTLLQAYAEFDIAAHEEGKTRSLRRQQVIGEHPAEVARHTREGLQAKLYAAIEQVRFDAAQEKRLADQRVRLCESNVIDAAQRLRILGVTEDLRKLLVTSEETTDLAAEEDVTLYPIHAPFDGTIIAKNVVPSQKAEPADVLFSLADLGTVWITANVPESDVAKLPSIQGGTIRLVAGSYPSQVFPATLLSVGAIVDPQTRTVPLLGLTENTEGLLKPGMFVRILLDSPDSEPALTAPRSAVVEIEGIPGVFIPSSPAGDGENADRLYRFQFQPVEPGREVGQRIVILRGLEAGRHVVASGAFVLKSELILQQEPEED